MNLILTTSQPYRKGGVYVGTSSLRRFLFWIKYLDQIQRFGLYEIGNNDAGRECHSRAKHIINDNKTLSICLYSRNIDQAWTTTLNNKTRNSYYRVNIFNKENNKSIGKTDLRYAISTMLWRITNCFRFH